MLTLYGFVGLSGLPRIFLTSLRPCVAGLGSQSIRPNIRLNITRKTTAHTVATAVTSCSPHGRIYMWVVSGSNSPNESIPVTKA